MTIASRFENQITGYIFSMKISHLDRSIRLEGKTHVSKGKAQVSITARYLYNQFQPLQGPLLDLGCFRWLDSKCF